MFTTRAPDIQFARPGLSKVLQVDADTEGTVYDKFFPEKPTRYAFERYGGISVYPYAPRVAEGAPVPTATLRKIGFRDYFVNQYGFAAQITSQARWTDVYNLFELNIQRMHLGKAMVRTREKVHALFLEGSFVAAADGSNLTLDGTPLFVHNHPLGDGTSYSNRGNGSADINLTIAGLETATIRLLRQPLYENIPAPASGKYYLIVPPELAPLAYRLTQSQFQPSGTDNDVSYVYGRFEVVVYPYLEDTNNWYVLDRDASRRQLYCLRRLPLKIDLDSDIRSGVHIAVIREEYAPIATDWRGTWGSAPA